MSPIVKRKGEKFTLPSKYLLFILTILCTVLMLFTFATDLLDKPLGSIVGYVLIPFEKGIGEAGSWLSGRKDQLAQIKTLLEENQSLKEQVALLTEENTLLQQDKYAFATLGSVGYFLIPTLGSVGYYFLSLLTFPERSYRM